MDRYHLWTKIYAVQWSVVKSVPQNISMNCVLRRYSLTILSIHKICQFYVNNDAYVYTVNRSTLWANKTRCGWLLIDGNVDIMQQSIPVFHTFCQGFVVWMKSLGGEDVLCVAGPRQASCKALPREDDPGLFGRLSFDCPSQMYDPLYLQLYI